MSRMIIRKIATFFNYGSDVTRLLKIDFSDLADVILFKGRIALNNFKEWIYRILVAKISIKLPITIKKSRHPSIDQRYAPLPLTKPIAMILIIASTVYIAVKTNPA